MRLEAQSVDAVREVMAELHRDANAWFEAETVAPDCRRLVASADMRYAGQNYELNVPVPDLEHDTALLDALTHNFNTAYKRLYDYTAADEAIEIVTFRIEAYGVVEKPKFIKNSDGGVDPSSAPLDPRKVFRPEVSEFVQTPVYDREQLHTGNRIVGPAVIEQMDSTTFVLSGQMASVDAYHNLIIEEGAA